LYGTSLESGGIIPPSSFIYFEWFIFKASAGQPATPTGGSWDFLTNTGVPPTGWSSTVNGVPLNNLWFCVAFVDSRNPTNIVWSTTSLLASSTSVYSTAYADTFTGTGSTTSWTLSADPVVVNNLDVSINGVTQTPTIDYTISGTTFTTTTAAPLGSIILVKYRQALPNSYFGTANNVGYTPHNWIAATNVQTALDEVADDISAADGVSGSNLVGYKAAGTGAVATTVQTKLRQYISVLDFGADPTGTTNSSTAIQAAINAAQGSTVYIPAGTYILNSSLELNFSTATSPTYQPATRLIGAGQEKVKLVNRSGAAAIKNTPTLAQTQQSIGIRFDGGVLSDFSIVTDGSSPANSSGIELASYWFGTLSNLTIKSVKGNGIYVPAIPAFGSNADKYSCGSLIVDNCLIDANIGWGINAGMYSITWIITNCYLSNNSQGAISTFGAGHEITNNAITGNGNSGVTSVGGIYLTLSAGLGAPENVVVRNNEFDNNWGSHIYCEGINNFIYQNRFIQDATAGTGGTQFRNTAIAYFDSTISGACFGNIIRNNSIRFDNATTQTIYGFAVITATGTNDNAFIDNTWSPSAYANNVSYVTKYYFPTNKDRIYAIENGIQVAGSSQTAYAYGQVVVTYVANTVAHTTPATQIKLVGLYNPNIANAFTFDDATWTFNVPYSGILKITSNIVYRPSAGAVNSSANVYVYKNGSAYHTQKIPQGFQVSATDQNYTFDVALAVTKGDAIRLYADVAAGTLSSISSSTATTTFQML
jgi:hypothetical protein